MTDIGGEFRFTNRHSDLTRENPWKAGDPWGQHYTTAGFEDHDSELEVYLASGVTTRRLILVDSSGLIVGTFEGDTTVASVAHTAGLVFNHNDPATTDSRLWWTKVDSFGTGFEEVVLLGPESVGQVGVPPSLILSKSSPTGIKLFQSQGSELTNLLTQNEGTATVGSFISIDGRTASPGITIRVTDAAGVATAEIDLARAGGITMFTTLLDVLNLAGSAHSPIQASAFTVVSTERAKIDIKEMDDDRLLDVVRNVRAHTFRNRARPQSPRRDGQVDLARRESTVDHDCEVDNCSGTADNPCLAILNDTRRIGLIAEHVYEVAPEITDLDAEHKPAALGVDQVAATAFGAVGALLRKVEALEKRIDELTGVGG